VRSTGGDLGPEAYRLGQSLARVHADLAAQLGTEQLGRVALADLAGELVDELGRAVAVVPELSRFEPQLRAAYARLPESASGLWVQRIHGDLHLGQALRTPLAWWLIDFEGEPVRSAAYRRLPRTPLRDVAGLLRSFDYAAHFDVDEAAPTPRRSRRVAEWLARNRHALSRGYASVAGTDPRAQQPLLRCLELGRAVYEATYEARNRPEWLPIPLRAMERLLGRSGGR
jgi:maltokinase